MTDVVGEAGMVDWPPHWQRFVGQDRDGATFITPWRPYVDGLLHSGAPYHQLCLLAEKPSDDMPLPDFWPPFRIPASALTG